MSWFFFALLSAFLFSVTIVIDKHLVDKIFTKVSATTITAVAGLAGIPYLILFLILNGGFPDARTLLAGFAAGWLLLGSFQLYYKALRIADASMVTVLYLMILPINYIFGLLFFDEKILLLPMLGLFILAGACIIISFEQREKKWVLSPQALGLMFVSSLLWSTSDVVFKKAADSSAFFDVAIAEYASTICFALLLMIFLPKIRAELRTLRKNVKRVLAITQLNEVLSIGATFALRFALTLGPLALVQGVMGIQPFFVLIIGSVFAGVLGARHTKKRTDKNRLRIEYMSFMLAIIGSVLISTGRSS